eukprot:jgi/Bigna1/73373/fgenesh1_pg.24_\
MAPQNDEKSVEWPLDSNTGSPLPPFDLPVSNHGMFSSVAVVHYGGGGGENSGIRTSENIDEGEQYTFLLKHFDLPVSEHGVFLSVAGGHGGRSGKAEARHSRAFRTSNGGNAVFTFIDQSNDKEPSSSSSNPITRDKSGESSSSTQDQIEWTKYKADIDRINRTICATRVDKSRQKIRRPVQLFRNGQFNSNIKKHLKTAYKILEGKTGFDRFIENEIERIRKIANELKMREQEETKEFVPPPMERNKTIEDGNRVTLDFTASLSKELVSEIERKYTKSESNKQIAEKKFSTAIHTKLMRESSNMDDFLLICGPLQEMDESKGRKWHFTLMFEKPYYNDNNDTDHKTIGNLEDFTKEAFKTILDIDIGRIVNKAGSIILQIPVKGHDILTFVKKRLAFRKFFIEKSHGTSIIYYEFCINKSDELI